MNSSLQRTSSRPSYSCRLGWRKYAVSTGQAAAQLIDGITETLRNAGFGAKDLFGLRLTLDEAITNGIKHGHQFDPTKKVRVSYRLTLAGVRLRVRDEGPGFDPAHVADPLDAANLERASGRGLFLMRSYMTRVRYNQRGNAVSFFLRRRPA